MAKKKVEAVVPQKVLSPKEELEFEVKALEHQQKYYEEELKGSAKMVEDSLTQKGREIASQLREAASEEYLTKNPNTSLTSSEVTSWSINALMWILPNLHIEGIMREAMRLDNTKRELKEMRTELAKMVEAEKAAIRNTDCKDYYRSPKHLDDAVDHCSNCLHGQKSLSECILDD